MDSANIEETRNKVSFDDLVSETTGADDESSIQGLVTVPEDEQIDAEPLPCWPTIYHFAPSTPNLYSFFDPPQNPERMRRRPRYPTIIAAPNYGEVYGAYSWRRVSFESAGALNEEDGEEECDGLRRYGFRNLLDRLATCLKRSEESRANILRHHEEFEKTIDLENEMQGALTNDTRSKLFDMVRKEIKYIRCGVQIEPSEDDFHATLPDASGSS